MDFFLKKNWYITLAKFIDYLAKVQPTLISKSKIKCENSQIKDQVRKFPNQRPNVKIPKSKTKCENSQIKDQVRKFPNQRTKFPNQRLRTKFPNQKTKDEIPKSKTKFKNSQIKRPRTK